MVGSGGKHFELRGVVKRGIKSSTAFGGRELLKKSRRTIQIEGQRVAEFVIV